MTSDKTADTFRSRTRQVVESFLQSVVILDDLAVMSSSDREPMNEDGPRPLDIPGYSETSGSSEGTTGGYTGGARLDADEVINGFADIGSVCAVLNPAPKDEFRKRTVKAARRADIVILDWKIHESFGDAALDVMREILECDQQRLRLIAIYTGEPDLAAIFDRIRQEVINFYKDDELIANENVRLSKGPLHVVILAKEGTIDAYRPELKEQEVTAGELAGRLADEFALMTGGLLRNAAIAGIAAIRDNAHRILAKFEQSLDPAYLGHRLLLHHPPEAEGHLVEALGSEVVSVLEQDLPGAHANVEAIESWLSRRESEGLRLTDPFPFQRAQDPVKGWRGLLLQGFEAPGTPPPRIASKEKLRKQSTEPFAEDADAAMCSNRRFAALLNLKTRYPAGRHPRLSIGTILCTREEDEKRYFLCLQPKCDSVRLSGQAGFPLIPLIPLKEIGVGKQGTPLRLVVETAKGEWGDFGIEARPSELSVGFFNPGPNPPGEVVGTEDRDGGVYFEDVEKTRYRWIAEMKDEHASKIAGEVASALARPGPNDAEWLRRAFGSSA